MPCDIDIGAVELRDHRFGRFDKRLPIGPVQWTFHDLFWIHEGKAVIEFPRLGVRLNLVAPGGVLILPDTAFTGRAVGAFATASICHFACSGGANAAFMGPGYMLPNAGEALHIQNLLLLAQYLARRGQPGDSARRKRLLLALIDGFHYASENAAPGDTDRDEDRLAAAWRQAALTLHKVRTLSDVAALLGIHESALRAMHRKMLGTSAGEHLRELRLKRAEELLATTGDSLSEIARQVGYGHAETLNAAFKKTRGKTPGEYRHWSNPFT